MKKPSVAAWVVNQLARKHRKDVDLLLDAGYRIREARAACSTGRSAGALRGPTPPAESARCAARRGEESARRARHSSASRGRLRAAGVTDEGRELLARGRFTGDLALQGFDAVAELGVTPALSKRKAPAEPKPDV